MTAPTITSSDCTTSKDYWGGSYARNVSFPSWSAGDLIICHMVNSDGSQELSITPPTLPEGETWQTIVNQYIFPSSYENRIWVGWFIASGNALATTRSFTTSRNLGWVATVVKVAAGSFDDIDPIGNWATGGSYNDINNTPSSAFSAASDDGGGVLVAWLGVKYAQVNGSPSGWSSVAGDANDSSVSGKFAVRSAETIDNESVPSYSWPISANYTSVNIVYIIHGSTGPPTETKIATLEQLYSYADPLRNLLDQLYSFRLLTAMIQYYGDTPAVRRLLAQYYGSATMLRRLLAEPYGDALKLTAVSEQEWALPEGLRRLLEHGYSLAGTELRAVIAEIYDVSEHNLLRQQLDQVYVMGAAGALTQRPAITVTADGAAINPHHISIEISAGEYFIRGEIHLANEADFLSCRHLETVITVTIDATTYTMLASSPRTSRPEAGRTDYYVGLVSPTVRLDAPVAEAITETFSGAMASAIAAELAASAGIVTDWQLIDWYLPPATLYANAETPLAVIRRIVAAVGGILQTSPAGVLICRPEYPLSLPGWAAATPSFYLTDMDNFFSVDATPEPRSGFNRFLISNQDVAAGGLTIESVEVSAVEKEIRVYQVPWVEGTTINLHTSGGSWVSIVSEGITAETLAETVEIVAGEGRTAKPVHTVIDYDWREADLGEITAAESGQLTAATAGNSLVAIDYTTRYHRFLVRDDRIEDVQFFPEEVLP